MKARGTMNKIIKKITGIIPFAAIITLNSIAAAMLKSGKKVDDLKIVFIMIGAIIVLNIIIAGAKKILTYFAIAISMITLLGILSVFAYPQLGLLFLNNAIAALYVALFCAAFFPPLLGIDHFTYEFSKKDFPEVVHGMPQFKSINLLLSYIWALLFAFAFVLSLITYTSDYVLQQILQNTIPIALMLLIGLPLTIKLPGIFMSKGSPVKNNFRTVKEMFEVMPFGLNTKKSEGMDVVIQFKLNGEEKVEGYPTISNNECTYNDGQYEKPSTTIISDSKLWLDISNGDVSGDEAYINKRYIVEGDAGVLFKLNDLFTASVPEKKSKKKKRSTPDTPYVYKTFEPNYIKKIFVVNASPRTDKFSKSLMMANKFIEGAKSSGAEVEMVTLKDKTINYCTCCYTCWTKTPGVCIFKDDMPELLEKVRAADLVVYITPLYVFSVSAQLKVFIDRMCPNMKPYMVKTDGLTHHPNRFEEDKPNGLVIFSAGGFPEVKKNFDGISSIVRNMGSHLATTNLMAEFFLPAAELLLQPVYRDRKNRVEEACLNAGRDAVLTGAISNNYMETVADPGVDQEVFMDQANLFWKSLDGEKSYNQGAPKIVTD